MRHHSLRLTTKYVHAHVREETERPDSLSRFFFFLFLFSNPRPLVDAPEAIPVSRSPRMQQEIDLLSLSGSYGGVVVAAGSCYRPQVRYADKQTMTNPLPKPPPTPPPPHPASPLGLRRHKFVNGFRDCRHTWDSSGFPNNRVTRQEAESGAGRGEVGGEASSAKAIQAGMSTGATFHKIKVPSVFGGTRRCFAAVMPQG